MTMNTVHRRAHLPDMGEFFSNLQLNSLEALSQMTARAFGPKFGARNYLVEVTRCNLQLALDLGINVAHAGRHLIQTRLQARFDGARFFAD